MLMDMPASHTGVDLYLQREPEIEFGEYARRLKTYGVALRKEDPVMITTIKVNKKNIEIHWAVADTARGATTAATCRPPTVGKSSRESDSRRSERHHDADRRRAIDRELSYLREEQAREERANKREARR